MPPLALQLALGALPALVTHEEAGARALVPEDWKVYVDHDGHNLMASSGIVTNLSLYWYGAKPGSLDRILDTLIRVTNENLPIGSAVELERFDLVGGWARGATAEFRLLGYRMPIGFVVTNDPNLDRMMAAVLVTDPVTWSQLDAFALMTTTMASLYLDPTHVSFGPWLPPVGYALQPVDGLLP